MTVRPASSSSVSLRQEDTAVRNIQPQIALNKNFLIKITAVFLAIAAALICFSNSAKSYTNDEQFGTLTVRVISSEPYSDTPYIFRLTTMGSTNTYMRMMRFAICFDDNAILLSDSGGNAVKNDNGEPLYVKDLNIKLVEGNYRIESPSDSRWRHNEVMNCYNESYNKDNNMTDPNSITDPGNYEILVTPHSNYASFLNNRIAFKVSSGETVICTYNFSRKNERWLTASYITEGFTE